MPTDRPDDGGGPVASETVIQVESHQPRSTGASRVINSSALLAGQSQLAILHNKTLYFLRQTRFGKLILTK
jgi:hemin uptake protein HemP